MIDNYLRERIYSIKIVRDEVMDSGKTEKCPLLLKNWATSKRKGCTYCKAEFSLIGRGCPCYAGYCKDRLIEALDKWIKLAGGDAK